MKLVIGNYNYSSWSLRAWLMLSAFELEFEAVRVALNQDNTKAELEKHSPTAKVPVLIDDDQIIWESLAICEYVSERYLDGRGWPSDIHQRAIARSISAEMHSGFFSLRESMPMNCRATGRRVEISQSLQRDIQRVDQIWTDMRTEFGDAGPWLCGQFSVADCMYAPVVMRFMTYGVAVSDKADIYMDTMLQHSSIQTWLQQASAEKEFIDCEEVGQS